MAASATRWIWRTTAGHRASLFMACLMGCLRIVASLAFVWVSKTLIDLAVATPKAEAGTLWLYAGLLIALLLSETLFSSVAAYLRNRSEVKYRNRIRENLYSHVLGAKTSGNRRHSGDIISRLTEDTRVISSTVCQTIPDILVMLFQVFAAFLFLYTMSPTLALCIIGIMPVCILLSKVYMKKMRRITAAIREIDSSVQSSMQEGVQHIALVKAMSAKKFLTERLSELQQKLYKEVIRRTNFNVFSQAMIRIGFSGGYLTAFIWSIWHLNNGTITFGVMTAFLQLVARIQNPIANLAHYVPSLAHSGASADRLEELEEIPSETQKEPVLLCGNVGIRFEDVDFRYDDGDTDVIHNFSYNFRPGTVTAIMGSTGIGKTTLIRMILSLLHPTGGKIVMYSDSEEIGADANTRCNLAYVPQGNSLVCDTVRNNLVIANPDATEADLIEALRLAKADFVMDLPEGLDTVCGERGARLSEGQAQRIAIARAFLSKGKIMLLDEFNSSLDELTARSVMSNLAANHGDRTVILITHRPDVLEYCDNVLRL